MSKEKNLVIINKITELGLPITDAEKIVASFSEVAKTMSGLDKELVEFNKHKEITKEVCDKARGIRLRFVKNRTLSDRIHKDLKSDLLLRTRAIDGVRNVYKLKMSEREEKLMDVEKHFEKIEQARLDKIHDERIGKLVKYVEDVSIYNLRDMSQHGFDELLNNSKFIYEQKIKAEKKAEVERIAKEKADEEKRKIIEEENKKLKAEAEAREKELEKERVEQENKLIEERKKVEIERLELEKKLKAEVEAREKLEAEKKEAAKLKEEQFKKELEVKRQAKLAPDKNKLIAFSNAFEEIELPILESEEAKIKLNEALKLINQAQLLLKTL